jgi:hypothetical protein
MLRSGLSRRLIALVAAYGLALQAMLAAVVVAAPSTAFASVICAPDHPSNAGGTGLPAAPGHGCDCPSCPLAGAGAAALPSGVSATVRVYGAGAPMLPWHATAPVSRIAARAGLARAPPA